MDEVRIWDFKPKMRDVQFFAESKNVQLQFSVQEELNLLTLLGSIHLR